MNTRTLNQKVLNLAVTGRLTSPDAADEPASELVERVQTERVRMLSDGTLRHKNVKVNTVIYTGDDSLHYERIKGNVRCIEDEIPFDLPEGWEWCRLGSLFRTVTGNTPPTSEPELYGEEYPFYKPSDLDAGFEVIGAADSVSEKGYESGHTAPVGSVLVTCIGTVGKTGYVRTEGIFNQQINAIIPNSNISAEYTYFSMCADYMQKQIRENSSSATMPIINKTKFDKLLFILPPIQQQKRIVEKIKLLLSSAHNIQKEQEELERLISKAKSKVLDLAVRGKLVPQDPNDEPASELLERIQRENGGNTKKSGKKTAEDAVITSEDNSYYENASPKLPFEIPDTWAFVRLKQVGNIIGGGTPKTSQEEYWNGDIPWITPSDMSGLDDYDCMYIEKGQRSITEKGLNSSTAQMIPKGAVLYSCRAPIGYIAIAENPLTSSQGIKSIVPNSAADNKYLYYCLKAFTRDIEKNASGATFKEISASQLKEIVIPLPPLAEQKRICGRISDIFKALKNIEINLQ